jgi:hypothetical protein
MSNCTRRPAYDQLSLFLAALLGTLVAPGPAYAQESSQPPQTANSAERSKVDDATRTADDLKVVKPSKAEEDAKAVDPTKAEESAETAERGKAARSKKAGKSAVKVEPEPAVPDGDPDFALLGEFVGPVSTAPAKYQRLALQVKPIGGGNFEAIQYSGGLPGERSHRQEPVTLIGKRAGDFLVLSGGPWAVFVEPDHCLVLDRRGERVGRLERIVRQSPTLAAQPPKDAIVLFDGKDTSQFVKARMTKDGLLMEGADIKPMLQDFNLHLEFLLPYMPAAKDQGRGNSGVYLQSRYELQILDSFAEEPRVNGCGSLYRFRKPDVNMCLPPLAWQTYDIVFTAARWAADGKKLKNARVAIWHNGVKIHNNQELAGKTGAGKPEEPTLLPTYLQDHRNPVRFRNIWIVDRGAAPAGNFPVFVKAADKKDKPAEPRNKQAKAKKPAAGGEAAGDAQQKSGDSGAKQAPPSKEQ